ncbi:MarR family winged helix-turn-helix transcriptional regulator [Microbacterium sp. ASV49]|uniref:MarR family transcriptional regulator n=1 Tax=Microbacterium candidum TaxID=3041922 RepID=A0ABT7MTI8_9MICO|nr:MarR family transcriptional regulator [Microbacterium sp. ASV49]MDL9977766.1 MarR family transcriptional regulator [Microbacterium sp. ASV49]
MAGEPEGLWDLSLAVFRMNGLLSRHGERLTAPSGQSGARWQVLGRADDAPRTVARMARELGFARQSVQRVADALAADGLVAYVDNPSDRRARLVTITPEGSRVLADIVGRYGEWAGEIAKELDADDLRSAGAALERIADVLEKDLNERKGRLS